MRSGGSPFFLAAFAALAVGLFSADIYFPIWLSVAVFVLASISLLQRYRQERLGILMILIWLVYALPFIHIVPYLWFDFNSDPPVLWGIVANPYMIDERVITLTAMIGAVGGAGVAFGVALNKKRIQQDCGKNADGSKRLFRTMGLAIWLVWVVIGMVLTALSSPQEGIFTAAYTQTKTSLDDANFGSAWMMSYIILTFAFCDALLETQGVIKHLKMKIILAAIILVVAFFQLLHGKRESISWVFGLILVYYYWAVAITRRDDFTIPWLKISLAAFGLVMISMILGATRSNLAGLSLAGAGSFIRELYESDSIGLTNMLHGTWSASLLSTLSVAGDHIYGLLAVKWGEDYLNFFLSIIPGFLADFIGYIRPIDSTHGPAWEMRYGMGGTHATVVPFMNFRMLGVFLGPAIWSFIMGNYEKQALRQISAIKLTLLVTLAMVAPHWLWYGEKYAFNAIVLWVILSFFYRLSLGASRS